MEEERRLCYVGMTRAKERLFLTSARKRRVFGQDRFMAPSRFLFEVDENYVATLYGARKDLKVTHLIDDHITYEDEIYHQPEEAREIHVGRRIRHPHFGIGVIKDVEELDGRLKLTVLFSGIGIKKVITGYVALEII